MSAVSRFKNRLPLFFVEYTFPERIKLLFHGNGDNQLFDGSDEIDEPEDTDKAYVIKQQILK